MRIAILLALAAVACAPAQGPVTSEGAPDPLLGPCNASRLGNLVGRPFSAALRAEALRRSAAELARVIRPHDMVTMDFRGDRLNIYLTAQDRVERFACG